LVSNFHPGNPGGSPEALRRVVNKAFLTDMRKAWDKHGIKALEKCAKNQPAATIVMGAAADPVGAGLIGSLARPGGNTTGLSILSTELTAKRLELLKEVMPQVARIAILQQPANPAHSLFIKEVEPIAGGARPHL
jgi:ABC transporter substrate binding protein